VDQVLELTRTKGKNEFEYECLQKMGEANEMAKTLNTNITYRAYKSADETLKCNVYDVDTQIASLSMKEFQREYNLLK